MFLLDINNLSPLFYRVKSDFFAVFQFFWLTKCLGGSTFVPPAKVAQLVEQLICNQPVGGSSPFTSSIYFYHESF